MKYWNDIFIHESYASFYETWGAKHVEPIWDVDQMFFRSRFLTALNSDSFGTSLPIHKQTYETDSTWSDILYSKGASVLNMFDKLLMKNHWNETHQLFVSRHAFQNADYLDYLDAYDTMDKKYNLTESIGVAPSLMVRTWMEQAGYPTVTFSAIPGTNRLKVTQKRFLLWPNKPTKEWYPQDFGYKWEVPLEYDLLLNGINVAREEWLHQGNDVFMLSEAFDPTRDWVLGNREAKGFYRVNYDVSNWQKLTEQLKKNYTAIDVKNRAMLVDDSLALARAGDLDQVISLQLIEYLEKEVEYAPWYSLTYTGNFLLRKMLPSFPSYNKYKGFMRHISMNTYNSHTWTVAPGEPVQQRMSRTLVLQLACEFELADCIDAAKSQFDQWKMNPETASIIHPDLRDAVYCTAIGNSTDLESDWDFLFSQYLRFVANDHFSRVRAQIRDALACFRDKAYLERLWNLAANKNPMIDARDNYAILSKIAQNPYGGSQMVWNKLQNDWDNTPSRNDLFSTLVSYLSTEEDYQMMQQFYLDHSGISAATQDDLNGNVLANILWRNTNEASIEEWLTKASQA